MYNVSIVGGGPNGLILSLFLCKIGLNVCLFEKESKCQSEPRAIHIDDETIAILKQLFLDEELDEFIERASEIIYKDGKYSLFEINSPKSTINRYNKNNWLYQPTLEKKLREKLESFNDCFNFINTEVIEVSEIDDYVSLKTIDQKIISSQYLIGCDGASSLIRKIINGELQSFIKPTKWIVCDLLGKIDLKKNSHIQYCEELPYSVILGVKNHLRFEICIDKKKDFNLNEFLKSKNIEIENFIRQKEYIFRGLLSNKFFQGKIILVGDSAHQTPPLLGQGLCLGIKDINNLYWKIFMIFHSEKVNSRSILTQYEFERKFECKKVIDKSVFLSLIMLRNHILIRIIRNNFIKTLNTLFNTNKIIFNIFSKNRTQTRNSIFSTDLISDINLVNLVYSNILNNFVIIYKYNTINSINEIVNKANILNINFKYIVLGSGESCINIPDNHILFNNNSSDKIVDDFIIIRPDFFVCYKGEADYFKKALINLVNNFK